MTEAGFSEEPSHESFLVSDVIFSDYIMYTLNVNKHVWCAALNINTLDFIKSERDIYRILGYYDYLQNQPVCVINMSIWPVQKAVVQAGVKLNFP
jgi:hypothetical protein